MSFGLYLGESDGQFHWGSVARRATAILDRYVVGGVGHLASEVGAMIDPYARGTMPFAVSVLGRRLIRADITARRI